MRVANAFASALVLLAGIAGTAAAQQVEPATFFSHIYYDMGTGLQYAPKGGYVTELAGDVYNNTNPTTTVLGGLSTTDPNGIYGDRVTTTGAGILQEQDFTIYNPSTSAGPLLTATVQILYFDGVTSLQIGGFNTNVNFGAGLPQGFFSVVTSTGLGALNINLVTTDVIVTQKVLAKTGTASRLGVVLIDPPTIGSSANTMYISNSTTPAGFYTVGTPAINANVGYRINLSQPVPAGTTSWGSIKAFYKK